MNSRLSIIAAGLLIPLTLGPANALAQHSRAAQPAASPAAARDASAYNLKDGAGLSSKASVNRKRLSNES